MATTTEYTRLIKFIQNQR